MKEIVFTQSDRLSRNVTIKISDEELFKQKVNEWIEQENSLNYWDLEEPHFQDCVILEYEQWYSLGDEDNDDFYVEMSENGFNTGVE